MISVNNFKPFWCHSCKTQQLLNTHQAYLQCPRCLSDLIEEVESFDSHPSLFIAQGLEPSRRALIPQPIHFFQIITGNFLNSHGGAPPANQADINSLETVENPEGECSICQELMSSFVKKMRCGHFFHFECLQPWLGLHNTCPVCRLPLK